MCFEVLPLRRHAARPNRSTDGEWAPPRILPTFQYLCLLPSSPNHRVPLRGHFPAARNEPGSTGLGILTRCTWYVFSASPLYVSCSEQLVVPHPMAGWSRPLRNTTLRSPLSVNIAPLDGSLNFWETEPTVNSTFALSTLRHDDRWRLRGGERSWRTWFSCFGGPFRCSNNCDTNEHAARCSRDIYHQSNLVASTYI